MHLNTIEVIGDPPRISHWTEELSWCRGCHTVVPLQNGSRCSDLAGQLPIGGGISEVESLGKVKCNLFIYTYRPVLEQRWLQSAFR